MRLILPQLDRERTAYGIKIATMSKYDPPRPVLLVHTANRTLPHGVLLSFDRVRLYIKVLGLSANNPSAQRLRNWKDPRKYNNRYGGKSSQSSGDFPALLEEELQVRIVINHFVALRDG